MVVLYKNPSRQLIKTHNGFTLIELLVGISIVAVLVSLSVSGFSQMVSQQRGKSAMNEFRSAVKFARSEARKRDNNIYLAPLNSPNDVETNFAGGWEVYYKVAGGRESLKTHSIEPDTIDVTSGGGNHGEFYFAKRSGRLTYDASISATTKELCFTGSGASSNSSYKVTINQVMTTDLDEKTTC